MSTAAQKPARGMFGVQVYAMHEIYPYPEHTPTLAHGIVEVGHLGTRKRGLLRVHLAHSCSPLGFQWAPARCQAVSQEGMSSRSWRSSVYDGGPSSRAARPSGPPLHSA